MTLDDFFRQNPRAAIGFSGGVDSTWLLYAAVRAGADVTAYYVKTPFQPAFEFRDALRAAQTIGARMKVIEFDVLSDGAVAANPSDRCYLCKANIFTRIKEQAKADGYGLLLDGTNASDDLSDRPGARALAELEVRSPLRECGLGKAEIRRLSREAGLFTADKPAYACLATRVACGVPITAGLLARVEAAEDAMFGLGFSDFRVRTDGKLARIQLPAAQFDAFFKQYNDIYAAISPHFSDIVLDLKPRKQVD